jgi:uncharacterized repeat protein (TIGR01451 family)
MNRSHHSVTRQGKRTKTRRRGPSRRIRPLFDRLEDRTLPANLLVSFVPNQFFSQGFVAVQFTVQGQTKQFGVGLLPITLSKADGSSPQPEFESLCADALHDLPNTSTSYLVAPTPANTSLTNGGEIAYLYNHHGYFLQQNFSYTAGYPLAEAVGLQFAIWELEYGLTNASFTFIPGFDSYGSTQANFTAALGYATGFVNEAQGPPARSESAIYLDATLGGTVQNPPGQGLLAPTPAITTTPSPSSVALGTSAVTLKDSAVLSGGAVPGGSITFTLVAPGGATVDTETVPVSGDNTYTTPTGFTLPTGSTVTGTYQWNASYSGDSFNLPASDTNNPNEQVPVSPASPSITTTPSPSSFTLGTTTVTLKDSAVLSGGYSPTGSITFTLVAPGGATVDTETVTVSGNGTYSTPTGYTLPTSSTVTGTYQWNATFTDSSGNNTNASDVNDKSEQVPVSPATPHITTTPSTTRLVAPDVDVIKTPDQTTVQAGQQAGFTIRVYNEGTATATGVTVNDPLPAGLGNDINWTIDSTAAGTNPGDFTITGAVGSQVLTQSSAFSGSLAPGQSISVHIVGQTTTNDVDPPKGAPRSGPAILPGTELTSSGAVAVDNGHQNLAPESQAASRPEITVTNLSFKVQPGYMILLENSIDTSIPEAGPPGGNGVAGVPSTVEFNRAVDWSDIAVFANITDSTGTHGVVYWCSAAENTGNQDTGTPLDTLLANIGSSNPGLAAPKATDNVVFLIEREAGRSGDNNPSQLSGGNGGGQSNPNNSYLTNNITYNTHTDPPGPTPTMVFTGTLTNTVTVNAANEPAAEMNDHATATITITTATTNVPPDVDVIKIQDQTSVSPGATAGFTLLIYNEGGDTATGVTLSDPLPPGANNDITWTIDNSTGNFAAFTLTGRTLSLNSGTSLAPGASLTVHVTGQTGANDTGTLTNVATVNAGNEPVGDQNATASANITVAANTAGSGVLNDTADLEGGFNPTGTITFTLYAPDGRVAYTQTVTVSHRDGLCSTSNTTVATQGGTYQWVAVYGSDGNNNSVSSKKGDEPVIVTGAPDVDVLKTPDQATIIAGSQAGFTITVTNEGLVTATGVTLNDPLPAGLGNDINWTIDSTAAGTNPSYFTITGAVGSQVLTLSSAFSGSLMPGQSISVHVVGLTSTKDVSSPTTSPTPGPSILPGTELTSSGAVAVDNGHQNVTPESQAKSRPEITVTNLPFLVQPGYMILLENTIDTTIPEAGPPPGAGVAGVPSATEFGRVQDWSDFAQFANITDSSGTHGVVYWLSAAENVVNQDTGTPLDTLLANVGPSYPGLAAPKATDNVVFLVEREAGRSGDNNPSQLKGGKGGGQSEPNNSYLTNNITYNTHTDPPGPSPVVLTGQLTNTATVTASNETAAETTDTSTAIITITASGPTALPDVHVAKVADSVANSGTKAGFTLTITNDGGATATGVTLSDLLPPGAGKDINWAVDSTTGNPTAFTITGAVGSQVLSLNPSGISLAGGDYLEVHITGLTSSADAPAVDYSNTLVGIPTVNASNEVKTFQNNAAVGDLLVSTPVAKGDYATPAFWNKSNGALLDSLNGGPNATNLSQWLVANFPNLYGPNAGAHSMVPGGVYLTNAQVAQGYLNNFWVNGSTGKVASTDANVLAAAFAAYSTSTTLAGGNYAASYGFSVSPDGSGLHTYNVGTNGPTFDVPNNSTQTIMDLLWDVDMLASSTGVISNAGTVNTVFGAINSIGHVNASFGGSGTAYTPDQVRTAYGINNLSLDGAGQTIAIVDAYDDPAVYQSLDTFDSQFGAAATGPSLYGQYGPASSFLTVVGQQGDPTALPPADPSGPGVANWETETALDVEWAHAMAPGAKIVLVEANSASLPDLMSAVQTAARQPGVSVVSMSWGFQEGLAVLGADEAAYDSSLTAPGVTFVASTGDYGTADPEYPAFSPNVLAVGGTSLTVNADSSYKSETGWGYYSDGVGAFIGSGGGISQFESQPAYQQGIQSTGYRTTPDVSFLADPATGAWIADPYNLPADSPWEIVGGTSLSAPSWAGLLALVNQGRAAAGHATLNSGSPTEAQQTLYNLPQSDFNVIASGTNQGYNAAPGYNLVTGLGTPIANRLVPDMIQGTVAPAGSTVAPLSAAAAAANPGSGTFDPANVVFNLLVGQRGTASRTAQAFGAAQAANTPATNDPTAEAPLSPATQSSPALPSGHGGLTPAVGGSGRTAAHGPDAIVWTAGNTALGQSLQGLTAGAPTAAAGFRADLAVAAGAPRDLPASSFFAARPGSGARDDLAIGLAGAPVAQEATLQAVFELLAPGASRVDQAGASLPMVESAAPGDSPAAVPAAPPPGGGRAVRGSTDSAWSIFLPKEDDSLRAADLAGGGLVVSLAGAAVVIGATLPGTVALEPERRRTELPRRGSPARPEGEKERGLPRRLPGLKRLAGLLMALVLCAAGVQLLEGSQVGRGVRALLPQASAAVGQGQAERPAADLGPQVAYQPSAGEAPAETPWAPPGEARLLAGGRLPGEPRPWLATAFLRAGRRPPSGGRPGWPERNRG